MTPIRNMLTDSLPAPIPMDEWDPFATMRIIEVRSPYQSSLDIIIGRAWIG